MADQPKPEQPVHPLLTEELCKQIDRSMLEDKQRDGYFQRACDSALRDQIRRQNMTGGF